ncbi:MAG: 30S ribosomal protein S15 [Planctomycetota bacterium]
MDKNKKEDIIDEFAQHADDTGSPEVQIALMTEKIKDLTGHLENHNKDHSARQGLINLVGKRSSLLQYLRRQDEERYQELVSELGLRK